MTREEAIINLKLSQNRIGGIKKEEWNALQMAIEALKGGDAEMLNEDFRADWIPCSKRLPNESGEYLVQPSDGALEDYSDFSEVMIMPYDADCEVFGWWIDQYDPISLGFVDSEFNEFEVLAWMPLPKPYKGGDDE